MIDETRISNLLKAVRWINRNERKIREHIDLYPNGFDYPDYFGMPESLALQLGGDQVDYIYEATAWWINERR